MERIKIYDILHHEHLCQICLVLVDHCSMKKMFDQLEHKAIKIKFFAFHQVDQNGFHCTFCVDRSYLKTTQNILMNLAISEENININDAAGMVAIYGPHFVERPGIIDAMHQALTSQGVHVLAISTTLSTSYFIIPAAEVVRAIAILKEAFEIPQGKV